MATFVSLFAGVGGFDLGFEQAGHTCVGQVEIDKHAQSVLKKHWPDVPLHDDVTTATQWAKEIGLIGKVDIVCGGFPCQDVSVAGKRAGIAGQRSGLFWDAIRFAQEVKAQTIVLENVPGLLSSNNGRDFGVVLTALADAGYRHIEWRILDSQFFGVPQRRRRVFIVGSTRDRSTNPILVEQVSLPRDNSQSKKQKQKTSRSTGRSFGQTSFGGYSEGVTTLTATSYKRPEDNIVLGFDEWNDGAVNEIHHTLRAAGRHSTGALQYNQVRRLMPVEAERLQGFPDDWTDGQADSHRYKQMGNAVTVNVARWIGERF